MLTSIAAGRYLPEYHEAKGNRDFFECCRDPEVAAAFEGVVGKVIEIVD